MKPTFIFTLLLLLSFFFFRFNNISVETSSPTVTPPGNNEFITGAMSSGDELTYVNMNALNLNLWHKYTEHDYGWTGIWNDTPEEDPVNYFDAVSQRIEENYTAGMFTYGDRPKFERLVYGQRSDYQAEHTHNNQDLWFYTYEVSPYNLPNINDIPDNGAVVKHCVPAGSQTDAGESWILKDLKSNREQCNLRWNYEQRDSIYPWLIKPRIRIPADAPSNTPNKRICRVEALDWDGNVIDSVTIFAKSFAPYNTPQEYTGEYREDYFYYDDPSPGINPTHRKTEHGYDFNPNNEWFADWNANCQVDFRVWWYNEVEMWIDYVRVDNEKAHRLLKGNDVDYEYWIKKEVEIAVNPQTAGAVRSFYVEEFEFNILPCLKYVNDKIKYWSAYWANYYGVPDPQLSMTVNLNYDLYRASNIPFWGAGHDVSAEWVKRTLVEYSGGYRDFIISDYPLNSHAWDISKIPNTLPACQNSGGCTFDPVSGILANSVSPAAYDTWLQEFFDNDAGPHGEYGEFIKQLKFGSSIARQSNMPFVPMLQAHLWHTTGDYQLREPTNEELKVMANIAVTYGAKGILWFWYSGWGEMADDKNYGRGLTDVNWFRETFGGDLSASTFSPRHDNAYHQWDGTNGEDKSSKFNTVAGLNYLYKNTWGTTLMSFDDDYTHSFIYRLERDDMKLNTYIHDVYTYKPGSGPFPCTEDFPEVLSVPSGYIGECKEYRYLQAATFENTSERNTNYFMIVNRRCSPFINDYTTEDNFGGRRFVQIQFDPNATELAGANGWIISDVETNTQIRFNKIGMPAVDLGFFNPGEGRLYKMTPIIRSGGPLAGDEVITGESFTCEDTIFSNGYNITIGAGTNMKFTDSSCIVMNGGVFTMGDQQVSGPQNITFDAASGSSWHGHSFTGTEVHIYGAAFSGLANDSVYALNMVDCPVVDIRNTTFNSAATLKGGINAVYYANEESSTVNFYVGGNTFTATGSTIPTINVSSFAGVTTPLIIENNTFTNGNTAVFLSGITGGAVKSNNISENYTGISLLSSYIDVSGNTISSTVNGSTGIFAAGGSEIKMNSAGSKQLGGMNNISNEGTGTNNIKVEGSYFLTDEGQNVFNISDISTSYHLYGYFPMFMAIPYDETVNCFKISGSPTNTPYNLVTDGYQGSQITFNFNPLLSGCDPEQGDNMMVLNLGDGINDTIYSKGSGSGGSESSINNKQLTISNKNQKRVYVQNVNTAYDSICMLMRSRNYSAARTKCIEMISNYPDSIQSLNALAKLYLASVSSNADIADLKVFYENLILNHPNNTSLVKRANYYTLKCKVRLHEYASALAGFQQIINENPYSYEGLIAKWDYMATSLLVPQAGSFGSEPTVSVLDENSSVSIDIVNALQKEADLPKSEIHNPNSSDDKSPFTKEQRIDIRKSINSAFENDKNENDRKLRILETRSDQGDVNAIKELAQVKALKQVVKTERPGSITEHIRLVSEDIQKVFGNVTGGKGKDMSNIPTVYRLSQNYPNPFNPVTNIKYQIPNNKTIVKIAVYDILGREVLTLVNNVQDAGEYKIDFNASNYASGVYFYRIEAEEPGGNKFVDSKKMVLIK